MELVEAIEKAKKVDWSKVKVDTPIIVWDNNADEKRSFAYFAKYENGMIYTWGNGCTSWNSRTTVGWQHAELIEAESK